MRFYIVIIFVLILNLNCKHTLPGEEDITSPTRISVDLKCNTCPSDPVCPVVDDIQTNNTTTYTICSPSPAGQGSFQLDANHCLTWTPLSDANEVVKTCILVCTQGLCDTTFITIFPFQSGTGQTCSPDSVYFEKDILPILTSNCAFAGCHNQASASDGVVLDSYDKIMQTGKIKPGNPNDSDLYEVITETKPDKIMPPPPAKALSAQQIAMIEKWIRQGAKNNTCDEGGCDTENISFKSYVQPALSGCITCHKSGISSGGITLDNYQGVKAAAASGKLYGSISWSNGFVKMPQGGSKMDDCRIQKIKSWIDAGSPDN